MRLINDEGKELGCTLLERSGIAAISEERLRILGVLSKGPGYPSEIARELGMPVQTLYYHIRLLERAGLLEFSDYAERNGAVAKRYICRSESIALLIKKEGWRRGSHATAAPPGILKPFIRDNHFDGMIVVGSPDPHGRYRARASELGMLEFTMFLGRYAAFELPLYALDTQLKAEHRKMNLILAGGPKVNTAVEEINSVLPIRFSRDNSEISSSISGKNYNGNIGIVELVQSPYANSSKMLVISGLNQHGTRAAVIAIVEESAKIDAGNLNDPKKIAKVIEGFDEDGDGIVDAIEILE